ncbi:MAG TPA: hypothetical protein VGJ53_01670 [Micromonosporaceae bacterium]
MSAAADLDALTDFFDHYGAALTAGDLSAIASCYAMPGMVVSDTYSFSFSSPAAVALSFLGAAPAYQERELVAAHAQLRDVRPLTQNVTQVAVDWEFLDSRGGFLLGDSIRYLIRMGEQGPQICVVVRSS